MLDKMECQLFWNILEKEKSARNEKQNNHWSGISHSKIMAYFAAFLRGDLIAKYNEKFIHSIYLNFHIN